MPLLDSHVFDITRAIQLAVAPVFLLTGVGAILNVLAHRLARAVDRSRALQSREHAAQDADLQRELVTIWRRAQLINRAIGLCTACALLVCTVVVALFLSLFIALDLARIVGLLFIVAMLCLIAALLYFMREVLLATRNMRLVP